MQRRTFEQDVERAPQRSRTVPMAGQCLCGNATLAQASRPPVGPSFFDL